MNLIARETCSPVDLLVYRQFPGRNTDYLLPPASPHLLRPELRIEVARAGEVDELAAAGRAVGPFVDRQLEHGERRGRVFLGHLVEQLVLVLGRDEVEDQLLQPGV